MVGEGWCPRSHGELGTELELESGPIRSPVAPCLGPASGLTPPGRFRCSQATCTDLCESSSVPTCLAVYFHNGLGNSGGRGFLHRAWPTEGSRKCWRKAGGREGGRIGEGKWGNHRGRQGAATVRAPPRQPVIRVESERTLSWPPLSGKLSDCGFIIVMALLGVHRYSLLYIIPSASCM